ncbi:MAG: hypothetical protein LBB88_05240 [Planctomycetaceae bacterium]|nr:hypothetical protein [Planctomycetaceae bacterium]
MKLLSLIINSYYALATPDQVGDRRFATFRRKVTSAVADDIDDKGKSLKIQNLF